MASGEFAARERYRRAQRALVESQDGLESLGIRSELGELNCLRDYGEGPVVVLLHGADTTAAVWSPLSHRLERFDVWMPDLPAFGLSADHDYRMKLRGVGGEVVQAVRRRAEADDVAVAGHSFGGYHGLAAALDHPDAVTRLAFASAPLGLYADLPFVLRLAGLPLVSRLAIRHAFGPPDQDREVARRYIERYFVEDADRVPDEVVDCVAASRGLPRTRRALRRMARSYIGLRGVSQEVDLRSELEGIEPPTLFLHGSRDPFAGSGDLEWAAGEVQEGVYRELEGLGHAIWLEDPEATADALEEFLTMGP